MRYSNILVTLCISAVEAQLDVLAKRAVSFQTLLQIHFLADHSQGTTVFWDSNG